MKRRIIVGLAVVVGLCIAQWSRAEVSSKAQAVLDRIAAEVDGLPLKLPEGATDADKARYEAEFAKLKAFIKAELIPLCTNKVFVEEVTAQNAKKVTLEEIQKIDKEWSKAEEELPIQKEKMNNACAREIRNVCQRLKALGETFVMDNQGANVGQNALTSDYWQGDEAKWKNSYKDGKGGVDLGPRQLDKSTNIVDQKVSLPIVNDEGEVIGAVCYGVKVEEL